MLSAGTWDCRETLPRWPLSECKPPLQGAGNSAQCSAFASAGFLCLFLIPPRAALRRTCRWRCGRPHHASLGSASRDSMDVDARHRISQRPHANARLCRDTLSCDGGIRQELAAGILEPVPVATWALGGSPPCLRRSLRATALAPPWKTQVRGEVLQHRQQRFRFARHLYFPNDLACVIHNADRCSSP